MSNNNARLFENRLGNMAPIQVYYSEFFKKNVLDPSWEEIINTLGSAGIALSVAFGYGSQSAQMRREVSCWALPSLRPQQHVAAPAPGPHPVGMLEGSIGPGGSRHKGVVLTP